MPGNIIKKIFQYTQKQFLPSLLIALLLPVIAGAAIRTGAERMDIYLPLLKGKRVAVIMNQTSVINNTLLVDTLLKRQVQVVKIFAPEHGFRGTADAGAHVNNDVDAKTGLPVISLYGDNKKPKPEQMKDIDVLIYDLQDVGVRFYTYISTMQYAMEACVENKKAFLVFDRPNPNGHYVDGPVLDTSLRSFVGMQPVPIVYGMTPGEYALMLKGEQWIPGVKKLDLNVIPCDDYNRSLPYKLPVAPSPNLKNMSAIYLYPSLCLFEGTAVSVGRGTDKPFMQWGHPDFKGKSNYSFTPAAKTGASKPLYEGKECYGELVATDENGNKEYNTGFSLQWLIQAYNWYPDKAKFFSSFFEKLAGTAQLRKQIEQGMSEKEIKAGWKKNIDAFKKIRKKYLLYPDGLN
ncbi:exo-beta-N-acetylmuramidase NamZ family protein [Chitinophagaceae bacterium MMS25-I14]